MLSLIERSMGGNPAVLRGSQVCGFVTAGCVYTCFRMWCPSGNVCVLPCEVNSCRKSSGVFFKNRLRAAI